jgi:hypothetical protein
VSLVDRTNETIPLSIHADPDNEINVDHDFDSSLTPPHRVHVYSNVDSQDFGFNMTYEEAGKLHDRLGLILGRAQHAAVEEAYGGLHFACSNPDHRSGYMALAKSLGDAQ